MELGDITVRTQACMVGHRKLPALENAKSIMKFSERGKSSANLKGTISARLNVFSAPTELKSSN